MERGFRPKFQGTATAPAFYKGSQSVRGASDSGSHAVGPVDNAVVIFGLVFFAVGMILFFRSREPVTHTGPLIKVEPSTAADKSTVQNEINTVAALQTLYSNYFNNQNPTVMQPIASSPNVGTP